MKRVRKEVSCSKQKFVILSFKRKNNDPIVDDNVIRAAMIEERLHSVSRLEFYVYRNDILKGRKPKNSIIMFGNVARGPAETGSLPGTPYLDTDGELKVDENWTHADDIKTWEDKSDFLFIPAT